VGHVFAAPLDIGGGGGLNPPTPPNPSPRYATGTKRPLLVIVRWCANILAIFLPNGASTANSKRLHVKRLVF